MDKAILFKEDSYMILKDSGSEKQEVAGVEGITRDWATVVGLPFSGAGQLNAENIVISNGRKS